MAEITMETDWGAKGAQLTGAQVQAFIKGQLKQLHDDVDALQKEVDTDSDATMAEQVQEVQKSVAQINEQLTTLQETIDKLTGSDPDDPALDDPTLAGQVESLKTQLNKLKDAVNTIQEQVVTESEKTFSERVSELETSIEGKAEKEHNHDAAEITTGTINVARIPDLSSKYASADHLHDNYALKQSSTSVATLTNVPIQSNLIIASIGANATFSLDGTPASGCEVHVIVKNVSDASITVALPNTGIYVSDCDSITIEAGEHGEINAISDSNTIYLRSI